MKRCVTFFVPFPFIISFNNKIEWMIEQLESVAGLSILGSEIPWEEKKTWSTMAFYMFCLHIPLSFGGLSMVSGILHQRHLEPQTQVSLLLAYV